MAEIIRAETFSVYDFAVEGLFNSRFYGNHKSIFMKSAIVENLEMAEREAKKLSAVDVIAAVLASDDDDISDI